MSFSIAGQGTKDEILHSLTSAADGLLDDVREHAVDAVRTVEHLLGWSPIAADGKRCSVTVSGHVADPAVDGAVSSLHVSVSELASAQPEVPAEQEQPSTPAPPVEVPADPNGA